MKNTIQNIMVQSGKMDTNKIRLFWFLLTLLLLVIGAGAPEGHGGWSGG
jgi:hypothetical protein